MDDGIRVLAHLTWEHITEGFLIGLATAAAGAIVAGLIAGLRFIRRTDQARMDALQLVSEESAEIRHWQRHVIRWIRHVSPDLGVPFPLSSDDDDDVTNWLTERRRNRNHGDDDEMNGHAMQEEDR